MAERRGPGRRGGLLDQYLRIKAQHREAILLFRLGDFYEMFYEDAGIASRALDLTLTARNRGDPDEVPLCGFPAHAAQPYITRFSKGGRRGLRAGAGRARACGARGGARDHAGAIIEEEASIGRPEPAAALVEDERFGIAAISLRPAPFAPPRSGWAVAARARGLAA